MVFFSFVDLPLCLQQFVSAEWLGIKNVVRLDSAMCNSNMRNSINDIYRALNFELFISANDCHMNQKLRWVVARAIKIPSLVISKVTAEPQLLKSFFQANAHTLKVLKLTDVRGPMSDLTKTIAKQCKELNTLCLERCNLTMPIVDILNNNTTIEELRLQKPRGPLGSPANTPPEKDVQLSAMFFRIKCPSLLRLKLTDEIRLRDTAALVEAFPNVIDLDWAGCEKSTLATLLTSWPHIRAITLRIRWSFHCLAEEIEHFAHSSLRKLSISFPYLNVALVVYPSLERLISRVHLDPGFRVQMSLLMLVRAVALHCNRRLEVLCIDTMQFCSESCDLLAEHCPNLRVFAAADIASLSAFRNSTQLERLRLGIHSFDCVRRLRELDDIFSGLPKLQELSILWVGCSIRKYKILRWLAKCPHFRIVELDKKYVGLVQIKYKSDNGCSFKPLSAIDDWCKE